MKVVLLVLALLSLTLANHVRTFHGDKVLRIAPQDVYEVNYLRQLQNTNFEDLDFWTEPRFVNRTVDIHVSKAYATTLQKELSSQGIKFDEWISDVQKFVDQQHNTQSQDWFASYHSYEEIIAWIRQLPAQYPGFVTLVEIGDSYEGRTQLAIRIRAPGTTPKASFFYDSLIHAREWITGATVMYMTNRLLDEYGKNPVVTNILNDFEIVVLPVFNPDGYSFTWTSNRMWRKTRRPNPGSSCLGTDPNRNFAFHWGEDGVSFNPCAETYCGPQAFSERETKQVADYLQGMTNLKGYINFHSYSELWMSSWGYTIQLPVDYVVQNDLSRSCVMALRDVHGTTYDYGPLASTIYPASGCTTDWTYGVLGVVYSYGIELRDKGRFGFLLPADQIIASGEETYEALLVFAQQLLK